MRVLCLLVLAACSGCKDQKPKTEWVDPQTLRQGPVRGAVSPANLERIKKLQKTFAEVDPTPLEKWVEDFSRDLNPEHELRIYEGMAEAYAGYCTGRTLTLAAKQDAYSIVLLRSGAADAEVLPRLDLKVLSLDDAKEILRLYTMAPVPITVTDAPP